MTYGTFMLWPLGKPLPDGWRLANATPLHAPHGAYSVLIEKVRRWRLFDEG